MQNLLLTYRIALALLLAAALPLQAAAPTEATQVFQAADGSGGLRILWWIPPELWRPGGFRLENDRGDILVGHLAPGAGPDLPTLSDESQAEVARIAAQGAKGEDGILLGIHAMGDWDFARALGIAADLNGLERRPTAFVVKGLGPDGKPDGSYVKTKPIDLSGVTPLHTAPVELRGENGIDGVSLYWRWPAHHLLPILAYRIERTSDAGSDELTPRPLILGTQWATDKPAYQDASPPLEQQVSYRVSAIDVLGREGPPAELSLFVADKSALQAPAGIQAKLRDGKVEVHWQANPSPNTSGYIVERSPLLGGPYEVLTPSGLPADKTRYSDTPPPRTSALYYRVRAIDPRGDVGEPGKAALVRRRAEAPPAPTRIQAEPGQSRVRLSWDPVPGAEGYQVERRIAGGEWQALGNLLIREPRVDDRIGAVDGLRLEYRVKAIAWGDATGPASKAVSVELPDTLPPQAPTIVSARSVKGSVVLHFRPAAPERQTRRMLVLRGGAEDPGLVIGDPLPGDSRKWTDSWVLPGETYWYRLVALDAAGNRSDPGRPVQVRVAGAALPKPARPQATLAKVPFRHVRLRFDTPPEDCQVIVQRAVNSGRWQVVSAVQDGGEAVDASPPAAGKVRYRLVYQAANDQFGPTSESVEVVLP